jgi:hypothetical protein
MTAPKLGLFLGNYSGTPKFSAYLFFGISTSMIKCIPSGSRFRAAAVATVISLAPSLAIAQSAPFAGLAGVWSGTGSIALADGSRERIRCRATYAVGDNGNGLQQTLRCASDSYKFDLSSNVRNANGRIDGTWAEATRGVTGNLQGRARDGLFQVMVSAASFTADLTLTTRGNRQTVNIRSQGTEFSGVTITLARS